ncbi:MAG: hypothetical protein J7497_15340, partial [Chitinophagaceae bacterium]|nr:hypothetical protein [Chitinophagaceae bacterium]
MPQEFQRYLDFLPELEQCDQTELPLFHVCSYDNLVTYLSQARISEEKICNVFNKRIIYAFYGASKYKSANLFKNASVGDQSVCIILDIRHCNNISKIYPFDSGAASGTLDSIREYLMRWKELQVKLDLGDRRERINKFILHCFKSLDDYVKGKFDEMPAKTGDKKTLKAKIEDPVIFSHVSDVHGIILDNTLTDNRRYFVEVLFETDIQLMPEVIQGVIIPTALFNAQKFKELLKKYRMENFIKENNLVYPSSI